MYLEDCQCVVVLPVVLVVLVVLIVLIVIRIRNLNVGLTKEEGASRVQAVRTY